MVDSSKRKWHRYAISLLTFLMVFSFLPVHGDTFSPQVIQRGATGDDVIELQARLQYIGYYAGKIDGVYGWGTYWAVRNFQNDFGLTVDGLVGDEMKRKLEKATHFDKEYVYGKLRKGKSPVTYGKTGEGPPEGWPPPGQRDPGVDRTPRAAPTQPETPQEEGGQAAPPAEEAPEVGQAEQAVNLPDGYSQNDLKLMANAVYGEARGEPYEGQVAVAAVILNRVKDSRFPNTVSSVIFEPRAFTAVADGQIWLEPDESSRRAVQDAINGWDPTNGLVYYFNPDTATSAWMHSRERVKRIGKHVFVR